MSSNQALLSRRTTPETRIEGPTSSTSDRVFGEAPVGRRQQRKLERRRRFKDRKRKGESSATVDETASHASDWRQVTACRVEAAVERDKRGRDETRSRPNRSLDPPRKRARTNSRVETKETADTEKANNALVEMLTISKEYIAQQPLLQWNGSIKVLNTLVDMEKAVQEILRSNCKHLGMDTETKPVFRRGDYNPTALIQLATETDVYLFRVCKLPDYSCAPLLPLLTNPNIIKTGVAIHGDVKALQRQLSFPPAGFVDCSEASFHTLRIRNRGLAALTAHFMQGRLCKRQQMSNWALEPNLSLQQIQYAATDAWYSEYLRLAVQSQLSATMTLQYPYELTPDLLMHRINAAPKNTFRKDPSLGLQARSSPSLLQPKNFFLEAEWPEPANILSTSSPGAMHRHLPPSSNGLDPGRRHRVLDDSEDNAFQSVFVSADGTTYEPYSLAWRYLGLYIDCDLEDEEEDQEEEEDNKRRRHLSKDDKNDCTRKLLWAAYLDPGYRGGAIGEYQFLDHETEEWNTTTCRTKRCARMDCHDPHTNFKLLGVYKETEGLVDWAEQLFKHHAYCQWDSDTYETMQNYRERWPTSCTALYSTDSSGNKLYAGLQPLPEGNMTIGVYWDDQCITDSGLTWGDYVMIYYTSYYYGSEEQGRKISAKWETAISTWNEAMDVYKTCQPCRSYNLNPGQESASQDSREGRDRSRFLDENEGEGSSEPWGYDCNDDAGYLNCDQCYKFETKTDMELVDITDLERASKQGSILQIRVNGTNYGLDGYESFYIGPEAIAERVAECLALAVLVVVMLLICKKCCSMKFERSPQREIIKDGYKAHSDSMPPKDALSNKLQAIACACDFGPVTTEFRVLVQKQPMQRE